MLYIMATAMPYLVYNIYSYTPCLKKRPTFGVL